MKRHNCYGQGPKANRSVFAGGTGEWISLHRADRAGPEYEYPSRRRRGGANGTRAGKLEGDSHARWTDSLSLVKTTVFLKDMNDFAAMNEVYAKNISP